jgi:DNA-binding MarR family transcriptional regulator
MKYSMNTPTQLPDEDMTRLAREFKRVWHSIVRGADPHGGGSDRLAPQQLWVLAALSKGALRMGDLADSAQTSQASLTGIVDRLQERGLVERVRSLEDRRVVEVAMTESGHEEMHRARQSMMTRFTEMLAPLSAGERAELLRLVSLIATAEGDSENPCT